MEGKPKKPFYKSWWFIVLAIVVVIGIIGSGGNEETEVGGQQTQQPANEQKEIEKVEQSPIKEPEPIEELKAVEDNVPREYKNALRAAKNYINIMAFSKKGLYDQLTSEYGDQYPVEAAEYAIENVGADWNEQALKAAINYLNIMPMSDQELFDQLTSDYGDKFTEEQARYAVENLPE